MLLVEAWFQLLLESFLAKSHFETVKSMTDSHLPTSKSTLMVVDDNPDLVTIIRVMLADKVNVRYAYSGPQLFAGLEKEKTDLIILDVMLPQMDGLEVLRRLKGAPETASIPVILITALDQYVNILTGCEMGADEYITKPFTRTKLITSINRLLNGDQGQLVGSL